MCDYPIAKLTWLNILIYHKNVKPIIRGHRSLYKVKSIRKYFKEFPAAEERVKAVFLTDSTSSCQVLPEASPMMNRSNAVVILAVSILFFARSLQADKGAKTTAKHYHCDISKMFHCGNSSMYIAVSKVCDTDYDCIGGEDELDCPRKWN